MTQSTDKQAGRLRRSHPIATSWLMYLCIYAYACVCIYANASCEIMLCGLSCPRSVGTSLGFHRYSSPGRGQTDRQMERQSIISSLVQRFSNLLIPNEKHIDSCFQLSPPLKSLTQKHPPES